jgi:glutamyl-tRNA synthetase
MFIQIAVIDWIIANKFFQFNLKITRGNTVVAFEKLWFLQKAHAQRFAATGGSQLEEMVNRVCTVVEDGYSVDKL